MFTQDNKQLEKIVEKLLGLHIVNGFLPDCSVLQL